MGVSGRGGRRPARSWLTRPACRCPRRLPTCCSSARSRPRATPSLWASQRLPTPSRRRSPAPSCDLHGPDRPGGLNKNEVKDPQDVAWSGFSGGRGGLHWGHPHTWRSPPSPTDSRVLAPAAHTSCTPGCMSTHLPRPRGVALADPLAHCTDTPRVRAPVDVPTRITHAFLSHTHAHTHTCHYTNVCTSSRAASFLAHSHVQQHTGTHTQGYRTARPASPATHTHVVVSAGRLALEQVHSHLDIK